MFVTHVDVDDVAAATCGLLGTPGAAGRCVQTHNTTHHKTAWLLLVWSVHQAERQQEQQLDKCVQVAHATYLMLLFVQHAQVVWVVLHARCAHTHSVCVFRVLCVSVGTC